MLFLKILQCSQENTCVLESLFNKVTGLQACNFVKKTLQHKCFFCECCEIFKNTYFEEHLATADSTNINDYALHAFL